MNKKPFREFSPDWVIPPGATIAELLEELGWSQTEFASRLGYTKKHVNLLIQGKVSLTEDAAIKLERVLGSTVSFWLNREALYREALARSEDLNQLNDSIGWLKELPIKDMINFGWIKNCSDKRETVIECLKFFGVASVNAWESKYQKPIAAFRSSNLTENHKGATSAWLRQGERQVADIQCAPFNRITFLSKLQEIKKLTNEENESVFIPKLIQYCAIAGVALAIVKTPKGCPISGATKWLGTDKALIILSDRYKTNDQFWFSFFHEAGHLLLHSKKLWFIDVEGQMDDKQEKEADDFASQTLIPNEHVSKLMTLFKSEIAIRAFAKEIGIAPGIVVGRMQKEEILPWSHLNKLKVKLNLIY
jgi:addiction module HigA family antidote